MATTVRNILERALRKGRVVPEGDTASPELIADALEELRDMCGTWRDTEGIPNALAAAGLTTAINEPRVVMAALVYELACTLADEVGVPVPTGLTKRAREYKGRAQAFYLNDMTAEMPTALKPAAQFDIDVIA
jgi:hypothetical protein